MEITVGILFLFGIAMFLLYQRVSELDAKLDIILQNAKPNWEQYFTDELVAKLQDKNPGKAAMILRQQTGLSLKYCIDIVCKYKSENT